MILGHYKRSAFLPTLGYATPMLVKQHHIILEWSHTFLVTRSLSYLVVGFVCDPVLWCLGL